jgi:hypothetical protein
MMRRLSLILFLFLIGCDNPPDKPIEIKVEGQFTSLEAVAIRQTVAAFQKTCRALFSDYRADVTSARLKVSQQPAAFYRTQRYGWGPEIQIEIRIADDAKRIPTRFRASGHTLTYYLGGGRRPGMVMQKAQSEQVCGVKDVRESSDVFVSVPGLAVVDDLRNHGTPIE